MNGTKHAFEYAVLRVVPRVERGEAINAGVLVYCWALDYLGCRVHLDRVRLLAIDPSADAAAIERALHSVVDACGPDGAGAAAGEDIGKRFRWATSPRSTVVQPGPVHTGLTGDPAAEVERLFTVLVAPVLG
jgi:Protein of unknown function (DUF3037)